MNAYDTQKMADVLNASHGLSLTDLPEKADVLLLNTCSIREKAQEKVFSELGRWRHLKLERPDIIIGVGGCVASQEGESILKRAPYVDIVFGPQTLHRLPQLLERVRRDKKPVHDTSFPEIEKFDRLPDPKAEGPTAFVSIMEGCSKYCSFCVVPYTRGEEISRPFDDVIAEIVKLSQQGVGEITLLGQNVNDYRGLMHDGQIANLALLIHYVAAIESIERIRFMTSHPQAFSNSLIQAYADEPKLANHLHLPVQSGSDRILAAMKRNYTVLDYKSKIRQLKNVRPDISLSTDIIVGFPGETDDDFEKTLNLVHEIGFDHSYCFIYSPRPGTPAAQLPDEVPMSLKKERLRVLRDQLNLNVQTISASMVGSTQRILVMPPSQHHPDQLTGHTENNRLVHFSGDSSLIGRMVSVTIKEAKPYSLWAEILA